MGEAIKLEIIYPDMLETYKCSNCKHHIDYDDKYCRNCGFKFTKAQSIKVKNKNL